MRTLNRPMFNMGGPIKQGIMHGIREPLAKGKIASGIFSKVGKLFGGKGGWWDKIKPTGKFRRTTRWEEPGPAMKGDYTSIQQAVGYPGPKKTAWEIAKSPSLAWKGIKENPYWSGVGGTLGVTSGVVPGALGTAYDVGKAGVLQAADLAVSDKWFDQDKWFADRKKAKEEAAAAAAGEEIVTPYLESKGKLKELTAAQKEKWADAQRGKRLDNLLDIMGYDQSRYDAVSKSLIDASKIVSDRGTLDKKNIARDLINPIIQATSKRLEKPEQLREAVGLMMAKGEIEKDLYKWKPGTHLKNAQDMADTLGIPLQEAYNRTTSQANSLGEDMQGLQILKKGTALTPSDIEKQTRIWANKKGKEFREVITKDMLKGKEDVDSITIVQGLLTGDPAQDDGFYQVGTDVIEVRNGVPKQEW